MGRILVVDDEEGIREFLGDVLEDDGHEVVLARDGKHALERLAGGSFHLMLTDLKMPRLDGMSLLRKARVAYPEMEAVVLTGHGAVAEAVEAMKLGAFDFLQKPVEGPEAVRDLARRALERCMMRDVAEHARSQAAGDGSDGDGSEGGAPLTYGDPAMAPIEAGLRKVAATNATVLLTGESGTGKEVAARAIHRWSRRGQSGGPFVAISCAAVADGLLESELFGHERGAFTGATQRRRGRIELADGGTFFLDEVGELKLDLQAKLLRVLQERRFERVGGERSLTADVRWVAATNRDLHAEMKAGRFREDLYHRLAVFPVRLPPLRGRRADILPLAARLLVQVGHEMGRFGLELDEGARAALVAYSWPGNVRELRNTLERSVILADTAVIRPEHLVLGVLGAGAAGVGGAFGGEPGTLADAEKFAIIAALAADGGHRKRAADRLGIGERTLYDKLKLYGLS